MPYIPFRLCRWHLTEMDKVDEVGIRSLVHMMGESHKVTFSSEHSHVLSHSAALKDGQHVLPWSQKMMTA